MGRASLTIAANAIGKEPPGEKNSFAFGMPVGEVAAIEGHVARTNKSLSMVSRARSSAVVGKAGMLDYSPRSEQRRFRIDVRRVAHTFGCLHAQTWACP